MDAFVTAAELRQSLQSDNPPLVLDVRPKPAGASTRRVTRERPKIDRIACPWLVRRFVDPQAEFLYVPAAGLAAVSIGLSWLYRDDHGMLEHGMVPYDALYAWCKQGKDELHTWNPAAYR